MTTKKTITFRTIRQAAIFELEIKGQLSDGHWENVPGDHWVPWNEAQVQVGPNVGRSFVNYSKRTYNLLDSDLLDCVGRRMVNYAKLAAAFGIEAAGELHDALFDLESNFRGVPTYEGQHWDKCRANVAKHVPDAEAMVELLQVLINDTYDMADLRRDLKEIMVAMKTRPLFVDAGPAVPAAEFSLDTDQS